MNRRTFLTTAGVALGGAARAVTAAAPNSDEYRACVIGDTKRGGYGHNLHLVWELLPQVRVVGLADPDPEGRAKRASETGAERTYDDYREMLEEEKPDLVSIGPRWAIHHRDYLLACASIGAHGLIEKPLSVDLSEADEMVQAVRERNLKWSIAFNFRATPQVQHARRMIMEEGLIGEVLEVRSRGKEDRRAGGEDLIVLGVHIFDMMAYFMGKPEWCAASVSVDGRRARPSDVREPTEPVGPIVGNRIQATFGFVGGVNGYFSSMKNADGNGGRWGLDFYGSRGVVSIRSDEGPAIFYLPEPSWAPGQKVDWRPIPGAPEVGSGEAGASHYEPIVRDLLRAIEENRNPEVSLEDGRLAGEMVQAVFQSHVEGGCPVTIPLENRNHPLPAWS